MFRKETLNIRNQFNQSLSFSKIPKHGLRYLNCLFVKDKKPYNKIFYLIIILIFNFQKKIIKKKRKGSKILFKLLF